jgi:hypothetical protein
MNNSKIWYSRRGHIGNNQFQQSAKTLDRMNVKTNSDASEVCETCVNVKQTRVPHKQTEVNTPRLLEKIHSNVCNEGTQNNLVQEGNNNVNMEDNKTKRKKKQKEKDRYCPHAQEKEIEAERNGMRVSNYNADMKNEKDNRIERDIRDTQKNATRKACIFEKLCSKCHVLG